MTEGRIVAGAAAGSYLVQVQGRETHNSAQDDLDAGHGGSVEVEEVYCAMIVRLALRCDMRTSVCKEGTERETASTQMHRAGSRACAQIRPRPRPPAHPG